MPNLSLEETKEIVMGWLKSCESQPQLDLLVEIIHGFVFMRFEGQLSQTEYDLLKTEFRQAYVNQVMSIIVNWKEESNIPTLFLHDEK